jgi:hypothetical protein
MLVSYPLPLLSHHRIKTCPIKLIYISLEREFFFLHDIIMLNKSGAWRHSCIERTSIFQNTRSIFPLTVDPVNTAWDYKVATNSAWVWNHVKCRISPANQLVPLLKNLFDEYGPIVAPI